ncbi:MAG: peptidylprolyl isomerase [Lachnospiraceae bacterium]|nr:peptidylprolyl isomerase [Lachnospiraceae bacterium]
MKKKKYVKIAIIASICVIAILVGVIVYFVNNDKYYFTTGIGKNEVFKVNGEVCTIAEMNIYLADMKTQYTKLFSDEVFTKQIGEISFEDYIKDQTKQRIANYKCVKLFAAEKKISLNKDELAKVEEKAKEYMDSLSDADKKTMKIGIEDVKNAFEDYMLYEKVFDIYTAEVNSEVSVDEARVIRIQYIFIPATKGLDFANECQASIDEDTNFANLAKELNEGGQYECKLSRGDMEEVFEKAAFDLHTGEISDVVTAKKGYYIIKCISDYEKNDTEINKQVVIEKRKEAMFRDKYDSFVKGLPTEFNNKLWQTLDINTLPNVSKTIDEILK